MLFAADDSRISSPEISTTTITERFCERVLAKFCQLELISDDVMSQILSQEHSGFTVWIGEPFQDAERAERGVLVPPCFRGSPF